MPEEHEWIDEGAPTWLYRCVCCDLTSAWPLPETPCPNTHPPEIR